MYYRKEKENKVGGGLDQYYHKYIKYKSKYLDIKNNE
jgi:hypothetical protein